MCRQAGNAIDLLWTNIFATPMADSDYLCIPKEEI